MSAAETVDGILRNLPTGFRFHSTDEELVSYLKLRIQGADSKVNIISEVDVCKLEPWDLPYLSVLKTEDRVWFFFSPPGYKYSKGCRSNRATKAGYWKPTGQDHDIKSGTNKEVIGTRKTLVFYRGRGRTAIRTNWVMHEYRADIANVEVSHQASSHVVSCSKETMQLPRVKEQPTTSGPSRINLVAEGLVPKSVKLEGNGADYETLQAKLARLSCRMTKMEENSDSTKAKDRAEYGSAAHLPQNKNPVKDSKKEIEVTQKENPKLSSTTRCNEQVERD